MKHDHGTARLRHGRTSIPFQVYHIVTTTIGRERIFADYRHGRLVVRSLIRAEQTQLARTLAFVVMPDHLHWLMQMPEGRSLSASVGSIKSYSGRLISREIAYRPKTWQRGFFDRGVRSGDDLREVARYIVANPLRAGLVRDIGQYALWDAKWLDVDSPLSR